jgi:hypothetical protein
MKGIIVRSKCCEGQLAALHGEFFFIKRIFVPSANNLAITHHGGWQVVACENYKLQPVSEWAGDEVVGEVEVPFRLVIAVQEYLKAQKALTTWAAQIDELTGVESASQNIKGVGGK